MTEYLIRDRRGPEMVLHPSTEGMLLAMRELAETQHVENVLDMGCGSGILTLAACSFWPKARVLAADISPQAVAHAAANFETDGLKGRTHVLRADALTHPHITAAGPYDLILYNMLAEHIIRESPSLHSHLKPGSHAVTSGILAWMLPQTRAALEAMGFEILDEIAYQQWRTLVARRKISA